MIAFLTASSLQCFAPADCLAAARIMTLPLLTLVSLFTGFMQEVEAYVDVTNATYILLSMQFDAGESR